MCGLFQLDKQRHIGYCFYLIGMKHPRFSYTSGRHCGLLTSVLCRLSQRMLSLFTVSQREWELTLHALTKYQMWKKTTTCRHIWLMKIAQGTNSIVLVCQSPLCSKHKARLVFDALKTKYNGLNVTDLQVIFDTMNNVSFCMNISWGSFYCRIS